MVEDGDRPAGLPGTAMPVLYRAASSSAASGQRVFLWITRLRLLALSLVAAASALSVADTLLRGEGSAAKTALLAVATAAFVLAVALEIVLWAAKPERKWYDGRAAAESLKTLVWRYSVGGDPFHQSLDEHAADALFLTRAREILQGLRGISLSARDCQSGEQITPQMRTLRISGLTERVEAYRTGRVQDQQTWYARKSLQNSRLAKIWTTALFLLESCGLVLVVLELGGVLEDEFVAIIAVLSASVLAWIQTRQFRTLAEAYFVASQELAAIASEIDQQNSSSWATFVDQAEEAISREHTLWRASRPQS
jgi:hypothetical protein